MFFSRRSRVSYTGRDKSHSVYNASLVSTIILGLSLIFVGVYYINYNFDFMDFDYMSFVWSNNIFTILLLLFAFYAIKSKIITEGILYLLTALSSILVTAVEYFEDTNVSFLFVFFIVGYIGCTMIFYERDEKSLAFTSLVLSITTLVTNIIPYDFAFIYGFALLLCGLLLTVIGCTTMVEIEFKIIRRNPPMTMNVSDEEYPKMLEDTVGSLLLALITFLYVYAVFFNYDVPKSYYIFTTIASILTLIVAVYGIYHKILGQTVLMFLLALSKLIFTIFGYLELGSTTHIDLMFVVIFVPLIFSFLVRKQYGIAVLTLATGVTTVAQTFTGYFFILEGAMALTNIMAIYVALDTWYFAETQVKLKDTKNVRRMKEAIVCARARHE